MKDIRTSVLYNREMAPGYYCLGIAAPGYPSMAQPGQFVMLRITQGYDPLLRRPFGIFRTGVLHGANPQFPSQEYMEVVYKVVGHGTNLMAQLNPGMRWVFLVRWDRDFVLLHLLILPRRMHCWSVEVSA